MPARRVGEDVLDGYLDAARAILAAIGGTGSWRHGSVSPGFDRLRWFELPEDCLRPG
jgi:hypothetical protein